VLKNGEHVENSPFEIVIGEAHRIDASKVKVRGDGCQNSVVGKSAEFFVNIQNAGS